MASVRLRDSFGLKYLTEFSAISLNISISEHITGHLFINDSNVSYFFIIFSHNCYMR